METIEDRDGLSAKLPGCEVVIGLILSESPLQMRFSDYLHVCGHAHLYKCHEVETISVGFCRTLLCGEDFRKNMRCFRLSSEIWVAPMMDSEESGCCSVCAIPDRVMESGLLQVRIICRVWAFACAFFGHNVAPSLFAKKKDYKTLFERKKEPECECEQLSSLGAWLIFGRHAEHVMGPRAFHSSSPTMRSMDI